jgi:unsaturated chondroitin disaccharide hydrolase
MNLSLLFWASEEMKDPRFSHIAKAHAETVLKHFIREDGSVRHIVVFDPENGEFIDSLGGQGYGSDSAWSRGQAWAIYGMANTYKYTKNIRYLRAAQRAADYFIASLPENYIPCWDFRAEDPGNEPTDTSAAACAASGMIEIAELLSPPEGNLYRNTAKKIIDSLTRNHLVHDIQHEEGILTGATGNKPSGKNINVSLIYGDYFYIECIAKLNGWTHNIF